MAEAAILAALGWVLGPVVKDLIDKSKPYLGSNISKELEDLATTTLPQIQLTIQAAQHINSDQKTQLARWLARLKNAYYDAEGILHDIEYESLKCKAQGQVGKKPSKNKRLVEKLDELKKVAEDTKNLRDILKNLKPDAAETKTSGSNNHSPTSGILVDKVFGRDGYRDEIINFLLDDGDRHSVLGFLKRKFTLLTEKVVGHNGGRYSVAEQESSSSRKSYSVVAIIGMGGVGKTTLAQVIYNNERVEKHFGKRMWLCLSGDWEINKVTKEMIGYCAIEKVCLDNKNLHQLQEILLKELPKSGNIMVILDNVLYDERAGGNNWETLLKPFRSFVNQGGTCKIVVTSRLPSFPLALLHGIKRIELSDLASDDFKSLLKYYAINGLEINNPQLLVIIDQIAQKMSKLPLAAKVVANQLRDKVEDITFWKSTLKEVDLSNIKHVLLWSFCRLDVQLHRCFLFCSVFPKGTSFYSHEMVTYWVALDFIRPSDANENVEDVGLKYFREMKKNFIFQRVAKSTLELYTMNDLFYDLAEELSAEDCFKVTNTKRKIPSTVQHVYLTDNNDLTENLDGICKLNNLRTLILETAFIDDISKIISEISKKCGNLRVLNVMSMGYKTLPIVERYFRNLRLLSFSESSVEKLPDSILQLYHLQFLKLPSSVKTLPTNLSNLIKLRRIEMFDYTIGRVNTLPEVPYLGKLTSLQGLAEFHVGEGEGYKLHQLGSLNDISGFLRIVNLENVSNIDEANKASLFTKSKLKELELVWSPRHPSENDLEVIEALQPPENLTGLTIIGYMGSTYPFWLGQGSFIENLTNVSFYNCNALTFLPQNFHQFLLCSKIVLDSLGALTELSTFPENLTELSIINCPCLFFVCENERQVPEMHSSIESHFFLALDINGCSDLLIRELKSFEQTGSKENCIEEVQIIESLVQDNAPNSENVNKAWWRCHQQRMNFLFRCTNRANKLKLSSKLCILRLANCCISDGALSDCLRGMATLKELYLSGIMTITTFPPAQVLKSLQSLQVLEIIDCWYLRSLSALYTLPHLQCFRVVGCPFVLECYWCLLRAHTSTSRMGRLLVSREIETEMDRMLHDLGETWGSFLLPSSKSLPSTLQSFTVISGSVRQAILQGNLSCLVNVEINNCFVPKSLSFRQLTSLKSLEIIKCRGLLSIRGLESTTLVFIHLGDCPDISELPELPGSVQLIILLNCQLLKERYQPNGPDWHKIQGIQYIVEE